MHNLKDIRNNFDEFVKSIKERNVDIKFDNILSLDKENRNLIQKKENLEKEKKKFLNQKIRVYLRNQKVFL